MSQLSDCDCNHGDLICHNIIDNLRRIFGASHYDEDGNAVIDRVTDRNDSRPKVQD